MARFGIEQGLQLGNTPPVKRPKLLKWLVGEGVSAATIQREWAAVHPNGERCADPTGEVNSELGVNPSAAAIHSAGSGFDQTVNGISGYAFKRI